MIPTPTARVAALLEDAEWLIETKTHPLEIATRLGVDLRSLQRTLIRYQRRDLASALTVPKESR